MQALTITTGNNQLYAWEEKRFRTYILYLRYKRCYSEDVNCKIRQTAKIYTTNSSEMCTNDKRKKGYFFTITIFK